MKHFNRNIGSYGEDLACNFLIKKHHKELCFILEAETYKDYIASYKTVNKNTERGAELTEPEYLAIKKYFTEK